MIPLKPTSKSGKKIAIHWIIILNILVSGIILISGGIKISRDIRKVSALGNKNLIQSDRTTGLIKELVHQQQPLRKIVNRQKFLVNTFAYEFDLFVAKEDGHIHRLETALDRMRGNLTALESAWLPDLGPEDLNLLKAHINVTIGIYEEAAEFETVGFGEIYRLAEESKAYVSALIFIMDKIEANMDEMVHALELMVAREATIALGNNKSMIQQLEEVVKENQLTLILIFSLVLIFQILFFLVFKKRVDLFSRLSNEISQKGDLSKRIQLISRDKFGELAFSFNNMLDNLQKTTISRTFLNSIIESVEDGILVVSPRGRIKNANAGAKKITGIENLAGTSVYDLFSGELPDLSMIIANKNNLINLERRLTKKEGHGVWVLFSASNLIQETGSEDQASLICVIRDITDRVQMEIQKNQTEKVISEQTKYALIGQVAGKMAHDFNNVLSIIMGNVELLLMTNEDPELKKAMTMVLDQTIRGKNLTKNLVAFAKNQEPEYIFFKISEKIRLVTDLLRKDLSGIDLILKEELEDEKILADPGMIEHALINLIQNSIHATSKTEDPRIIIRSYRSQTSVCIEIEDNGCGIPEEFLDNIFDPSFTLKGTRDRVKAYRSGIKGTGYGLSNVKKYVDQHKGKIGLESTTGVGTKVRIMLPVINQTLTHEEKKEVAQKITSIEKHVLIVEDEPAISNVQSTLLSGLPCRHRVEIATSGEAAIKLMDMNHYDLISMDYMLAGKMNGMDIYNEMRASENFIPVLFVSGNIEFLESIKELKSNDEKIGYLSKPCQNKEYLYAVNALLEKFS